MGGVASDSSAGDGREEAMITIPLPSATMTLAMHDDEIVIVRRYGNPHGPRGPFQPRQRLGLGPLLPSVVRADGPVRPLHLRRTESRMEPGRRPAAPQCSQLRAGQQTHRGEYKRPVRSKTSHRCVPFPDDRGVPATSTDGRRFRCPGAVGTLPSATWRTTTVSCSTCARVSRVGAGNGGRTSTRGPTSPIASGGPGLFNWFNRRSLTCLPRQHSGQPLRALISVAHLNTRPRFSITFSLGLPKPTM